MSQREGTGSQFNTVTVVGTLRVCPPKTFNSKVTKKKSKFYSL